MDSQASPSGRSADPQATADEWELRDIRLRLSDMVVDGLITEDEFSAAQAPQQWHDLWTVAKERKRAREDEKARRRLALAEAGGRYFGTRICFTGFRPDAEQTTKLEAMGFLLQDKFDVRVHLVVTEGANTSTTKVHRANDLHVPVITARELWRALKRQAEFVYGQGFAP